MRNIPAALVRPYFQLVLQQDELTPNALAKRAKLPNTTISRPLSPKYKGEVRPSTVEKVARVTRVPLPEELAALVKVNGSSDMELAVIIADRIPLGRAFDAKDRAALAADIVQIVRSFRPS